MRAENVADSWYNRGSGSHCRSAGKIFRRLLKNPGILRTYFQNLVPDLLNFALQVVIAVIVYAVGAKLIGLIVKIVSKNDGAQKCRCRSDTVPVCSREICTVFYPDPDNLKPVWDSNYLSGGSARFLWCGGWSCTAGKSLQLCRRSADPFAKTILW